MEKFSQQANAFLTPILIVILAYFGSATINRIDRIELKLEERAIQDARTTTILEQRIQALGDVVQNSNEFRNSSLNAINEKLVEHEKRLNQVERKN